MLQRVAKIPIPPHKPEIRKQRSGRNQQARQQKQPAPPVWIPPHLPKTNRDHERSQRRQHRQRSQRIAMNLSGPRQPERSPSGNQRNRRRSQNPRPLRRPGSRLFLSSAL